MANGGRNANAVFPVRFRAALNANKLVIALEILVFIALLVAGFAGLIPFGATPALFLFAWASLWLRGKRWADCGLTRPTKWLVLAACGLGVGFQFLSAYVIDPTFARWSGRLPDVSQFASVVGNVRLLAFWVFVSWTLAAFGEEFVYRGYLMNRLAELGDKTRVAWIASLILSSLFFALAHMYQGLAGVLSVAVTSLVLGTIYLMAKRNLFVVVLFHGIMDTTGFLLMFLGKYPGL